MIAKVSSFLGPGSLFTGERSLDLLWTSISNVPVIDPNDVTQWNTWFDTEANAVSPFTSVKVSGNKVSLFGGKNITLKDVLFSSGYDKQPTNNIVSIDDNAGSITTLQYGNFANCDSLTSVNLPGVTQSIGYGGYVFAYCNVLSSVSLPNLQTSVYGMFSGCPSITSISLPSLVTMGGSFFEYCTSFTSLEIPICTSLGESVVYNGIFYGISGQTFSLTIPPDLLICDGGNPDADIINLQSNNTVTIHIPTEITSFTPTNISPPGGTVSITGKGFYSINSVTFGGVQATTYSVNSFTSIDAYVENASSGNIVIQGTYGSASKSGFIYDDPVKLFLDAGVTSSITLPIWSDLSAYNNDILLESNITQGSYSLIFDGTPNSYGTSSLVTIEHPDGFTVESWAKFYDFNSRGVVTFNGSNYGDGSKYINLQGMTSFGNSVRWEYFAGNSIFSNGGLSPNTWYHLVGVYDKSQNLASIYINGSYNNSTSYNLSATFSTAEFKVGLHDNFMNGEISTVKFINKPYSASEVLDSFNNTKATFGY